MDWEESLYDYQDILNRDEEDIVHEMANTLDVEGENDEFDEDFNDNLVRDEDDNIDYTVDFKHLQQVSSGRGTTAVMGINAQKAMRSAEETVTDQLRGILNSDLYKDLSDTKRDIIVNKAESVKNVVLLNLEILIQAILWTTLEKPLNKKTFSDFTKRYETVDAITLLTYVRYLSSPLHRLK
jgi:hypothetical protein